MNTILSKASLKIGTTLAISSFFVIAMVLAFAPRVVNHTKAESCSPVYSQPIFNPYPVTWNNDAGFDCTDFATLSAGVHGAGQYSDNISANVGDTITVRVYVHNGAATNSNAVMHGVSYNVSLDNSSGVAHYISAQLRADNASEKDGSITINTPSGATLQYVGGDPLQQNLGDQQPCFDFARQFYITLKVVGPIVTATPSGTISGTVGGQVGAQCLFDGSVQWSTQNVGSAQVFVVNPDNGQEQLFASNVSGSGDAPWIQPNKSYVFNLYSLDNGKVLLKSTTLSTSQTCGGAGTPPSSTVNLTVSNFCVGQTPTYTVQGSNDLGGQQIYWSSTLNGASTGEVNANYGQVLNSSSAYWSGPGSRAWTTNDIGSWTKTVGVLKNGQVAATSQPFAFTVQNCGGGTTSVICSANVASANVGDSVIFTATGGNGTYTWTSTGIANSGTGSVVGISFPTSGNKLVSVSSNGQTGSCGVFINTAVSTATTTASSYNNCVNNSCNYNYTNTYSNTTYPNNYPVYSYTQPPVYNYTPAPVYVAATTYTPSVLGGNVNLNYSKTAVNETKNADATSVIASREDFITYTLTVSNSGNTPANSFIITDDLSQVLPFADMVDNGGGSLSGNTISFPGITVPAGGSVSRSFKVRVKYSLASNLSYTMSNTYGNTVTIHINKAQVLGAFIAPKTGADTNAFIFASLLTAAAVLVKKRKEISKLIFS